MNGHGQVPSSSNFQHPTSNKVSLSISNLSIFNLLSRPIRHLLPSITNYQLLLHIHRQLEIFRSRRRHPSRWRSHDPVKLHRRQTDVTLRRANYRAYLYVTVDGQPANALPRDLNNNAYVILPHLISYPAPTRSLSPQVYRKGNTLPSFAQTGVGINGQSFRLLLAQMRQDLIRNCR